MPSNNEIIDEIEKVKQIALTDLKALGIHVNCAELEVCDIKVIYSAICLEDPEDLLLDSLDEYDSADEECAGIGNSHENGNQSSETSNVICDARDYSNLDTSTETEGITIDKNGPFAVVTDGNGNRKIVRKSSICWLLTKTNSRISSDRLLRVRECDIDANL